MLIAIWATDNNNLVGKDNYLPWNIKSELEHFKKTTDNKKILMGQTTFDNIPVKLVNRQVFVITNNKNYLPKFDNAKPIFDLKNFVKKFQNNLQDDLYVCGGITVYKALIPKCDFLIISYIKKSYQGNKFLHVDLTNFTLISTEDKGEFIVKKYQKII